MRKIINQIDTITGEGDQEIKGQATLKKEAHNHFKNLLRAEPLILEFESFTKHIPKRIKEEANLELLKEVEEHKIQVAVWSL